MGYAMVGACMAACAFQPPPHQPLAIGGAPVRLCGARPRPSPRPTLPPLRMAARDPEGKTASACRPRSGGVRGGQLSSQSVCAPIARNWCDGGELRGVEQRAVECLSDLHILFAGEQDAAGLRTMFSPPWACMSKCGACCYLAPQERDLTGLSDEERATYIGMAGADGWCINFDRGTHLCKIYEERPGFCRIESLGPMYGVAEEELGDFAADSCRDHIGQLCGDNASELDRFETLQEIVRKEAGWVQLEEELEEVGMGAGAGGSQREELQLARLGLLKALESLPDGDAAAAEGLREVLAQVDAAISSLDRDP